MGETRKLKGGKYKYAGTYGCTYFPAMKCKGDLQRTPFSISKIMEKSDAIAEYQKQSLLKKIDPDQKFFLWPTRICDVQKSDLDLVTEDKLAACDLVGHRFKSNLRDAKLIYYRNGGTDLDHLSLTPRDYEQFFIGLGQLLEGLALLHSRDAVHLDIKPGNIVADLLPNGAFDFHFIDFGFSCKTRNHDREDIPNVNYFIWPYEYRFAKYTFKKSDINDADILDFFTDSVNDEDYLPKPILLTNKTTEKANYDMYQSFGESRGDKLTSLLKAVDVYSLGISFAKIYYDFIGHAVIGPNVDDIDIVNKKRLTGHSGALISNYFIYYNVSKHFFEFVAKLVQPDLSKRLTAREAYEEFQQLIPMFDALKSEKAAVALSALDRSVASVAPPTPTSPGLQRIQTNLFVSEPLPTTTVGGKKRKTQKMKRKRKL